MSTSDDNEHSFHPYIPYISPASIATSYGTLHSPFKKKAKFLSGSELATKIPTPTQSAIKRDFKNPSIFKLSTPKVEYKSPTIPPKFDHHITQLYQYYRSFSQRSSECPPFETFPTCHRRLLPKRQVCDMHQWKDDNKEWKSQYLFESVPMYDTQTFPSAEQILERIMSPLNARSEGTRGEAFQKSSGKDLEMKQKDSLDPTFRLEELLKELEKTKSQNMSERASLENERITLKILQNDLNLSQKALESQRLEGYEEMAKVENYRMQLHQLQNATNAEKLQIHERWKELEVEEKRLEDEKIVFNEQKQLFRDERKQKEQQAQSKKLIAPSVNSEATISAGTNTKEISKKVLLKKSTLQTDHPMKHPPEVPLPSVSIDNSQARQQSETRGKFRSGRHQSKEDELQNLRATLTDLRHQIDEDKLSKRISENKWKEDKERLMRLLKAQSLELKKNKSIDVDGMEKKKLRQSLVGKDDQTTLLKHENELLCSTVRKLHEEVDRLTDELALEKKSRRGTGAVVEEVTIARRREKFLEDELAKMKENLNRTVVELDQTKLDLMRRVTLTSYSTEDLIEDSKDRSPTLNWSGESLWESSLDEGIKSKQENKEEGDSETTFRLRRELERIRRAMGEQEHEVILLASEVKLLTNERDRMQLKIEAINAQEEHDRLMKKTMNEFKNVIVDELAKKNQVLPSSVAWRSKSGSQETTRSPSLNESRSVGIDEADREETRRMTDRQLFPHRGSLGLSANSRSAPDLQAVVVRGPTMTGGANTSQESPTKVQKMKDLVAGPLLTECVLKRLEERDELQQPAKSGGMPSTLKRGERKATGMISVVRMEGVVGNLTTKESAKKDLFTNIQNTKEGNLQRLDAPEVHKTTTKLDDLSEIAPLTKLPKRSSQRKSTGFVMDLTKKSFIRQEKETIGEHPRVKEAKGPPEKVDIKKKGPLVKFTKEEMMKKNILVKKKLTKLALSPHEEKIEFPKKMLPSISRNIFPIYEEIEMQYLATDEATRVKMFKELVAQVQNSRQFVEKLHDENESLQLKNDQLNHQIKLRKICSIESEIIDHSPSALSRALNDKNEEIKHLETINQTYQFQNNQLVSYRDKARRTFTFVRSITGHLIQFVSKTEEKTEGFRSFVLLQLKEIWTSIDDSLEIPLSVENSEMGDEKTNDMGFRGNLRSVGACNLVEPPNRISKTRSYQSEN